MNKRDVSQSNSCLPCGVDTRALRWTNFIILLQLLYVSRIFHLFSLHQKILSRYVGYLLGSRLNVWEYLSLNIIAWTRLEEKILRLIIIIIIITLIIRTHWQNRDFAGETLLITLLISISDYSKCNKSRGEFLILSDLQTQIASTTQKKPFKPWIKDELKFYVPQAVTRLVEAWDQDASRD